MAEVSIDHLLAGRDEFLLLLSRKGAAISLLKIGKNASPIQASDLKIPVGFKGAGVEHYEYNHYEYWAVRYIREKPACPTK